MTKTSIPLNATKIQVLIKSLLFILLFILLLFAGSMLQMMFPMIKSKFMYGTLGCLGGLIVVWLFLKIDKQPFAAINLVWERKTPLRFVYGLLIGTAIFTLMFIPIITFSALTITYNPAFQWASLGLYVTLIPLALMEEIGFRSYPLVKLHKNFGLWMAQVIIALAFAIYHILNGWTIYAAFAGTFVWAFVFGLAAIWSRGIAMPTGIHLAVNILQNATGLKGGKDAIWLLDYPKGTSAALMARTDHIGFAMQMVVLVLALGVMWWYNTPPKASPKGRA